MQTHGKYIFVGKLWLKNAPVFHVAPTTEIEYPWRVCEKSLIIRYSKRRGIVVGIWKENKRDWQETVLEALEGRKIQKNEILKALKAQNELGESGVQESEKARE